MLPKNFIVIFLIFIIFSTTGCMNTQKRTDDLDGNIPETTTLEPSDEFKMIDGVKHDDVSANFIITTYPIRIYKDNEGKRIEYRYSVENKTESTIKDFEPQLLFDEALEKLLAAGTVQPPMGKIDIAAKNAKNVADSESFGGNYIVTKLLASEEHLRQSGTNPNDINIYGKKFKILLKWSEGEEQYDFESEILDETK